MEKDFDATLRINWRHRSRQWNMDLWTGQTCDTAILMCVVLSSLLTHL